MRSILLMGSGGRYQGFAVIGSGLRNIFPDRVSAGKFTNIVGFGCFGRLAGLPMPDPSLLCLRGQLVVLGKSPDGDSIRFLPDTPALVGRLTHGDRADPSADGTLQLRLDGIDTPETHYNGQAQPLGVPARDELLAWCGFRDVQWSGATVSAAT